MKFSRNSVEIHGDSWTAQVTRRRVSIAFLRISIHVCLFLFAVSGIASAQTTATVYTDSNGNMGIGTTGPISKLQVTGTLTATAFSGDGSLLTGISAGGWTDGGTNVFTSTTTDNVGIGTTTPTSTLEVVKTAAGTAPFMISATATADGDYFIVSSSGNVGIGSTTPVALVVNRTALNLYSGTGTEIRMNHSSGNNVRLYNTGTAFGITNEGNTGGSNINLTAGFATIDMIAATVFTGISDTSPEAMLEISSSGIATRPGLMVSSNDDLDGDWFIVGPNGNVGIGTTAPVGGLVVMNGNVGIGTWSPTAMFQIGSGATQIAMSPGSVNLMNTNLGFDVGAIYFGTTANGVVSNNSAGANSGVTLLGGGGASSNVLIQSTNIAGTGDFIDFLTGNNGSNRTRIISSGNIGIGTTAPVGGLTVMNGNVGIGTWSPTYRLQVIGTLDATTITQGGVAIGGSSGWTDGGTNVFTSLTTDNVGIGTTTPSTTLEIVKSSNRSPLMISSVPTGDGDYVIVTSAGSVGIGTTQFIGALSVMSGNVGIGTWSPQEFLSVAGNSSGGQPYVRMSLNNPTVGSNGSSFRYYNGNTLGGAVVYNNIGQFELNAEAAGSYTTFSIAGTERVRFDTNGNVGIGTTTPVAGLVVMNGNVGIGTWNPSSAFQIGTGSTGPNTPFAVTSTGVIASNSSVAYQSNYPGAARIYNNSSNPASALSIEGGGTATGYLSLQSTVGVGTSDFIKFLVGNNGATEAMRIITSGNIGIGTTTPVGALTVMNGNVGIGTWSPVAALQVKGTGIGSVLVGELPGFNTYGAISLNGSMANFNFASSPGDTTLVINRNNGAEMHFREGNATASQMVIVSGGNIGIGTLTPVGGLTVMNGNVGIGTWVVDGVSGSLIVAAGVGNVGIGTIRPGTRLDVNGTVRATAFSGDGSGLTGISAGGWTDGGTNVFTSLTTDNVGIGTTSPTSTLEVVKTAAGTAPLMISTVATGDGNVFIVTSGGNVGIGTITPVGGLAVMNGNVGIGTWSPVTKLQINEPGTTVSALHISRPEHASTSPSAFSTVDSTGTETVGFTSWDGGGEISGGYGAIVTSANCGANGCRLGEISGKNSANGNRIADIIFQTGSAADKGQIEFDVGIGGAAFRQAMLIDDNGSVGIGTLKASAITGLTVMNGNVGIGTWSPTSKLQVVGTVSATILLGDGSLISNLPSQGTGGWTDGGTNVFPTTTTDVVGIGTTTSSTTFEIVTQSSKSPLMVSSVPTGDGDYLLVTSGGRVGIGTNSPSSAALLELKSTDKALVPPRMTAAQRDAITSPLTGSIVYVTDTTAGYYTYTGTVWRPIYSGATTMAVKRKTADQSSVNNTLANDSDLVMAIAANEVWTVEGNIYALNETATTADLQIAFTVPAGATMVIGFHSSFAAATNFNSGELLTSGTGSGLIALGNNVVNAVFIQGLVVNGGTAGNIQFQFAQFTTQAGDPTYSKAGSYLKFTKAE